MFWIFLIVVIASALVYLFIVRPLLKQQPLLSKAFAAEASLWQKLQAKVTGWRTQIAARLTIIAGAIVGLYDQALPLVTGQDWTPLTAKVPPWALPVGLVFLGTLFAYLRKLTENPPQIITQRENGVAQVVDVLPPAKA